MGMQGLGNAIATARRGLNLTQEQLAQTLQVARQTVSKWEADLAVPETGKLPLLAKTLGCSVDDLLGVATLGKVQVKAAETGYEIDWSERYPILKRYQGEMDLGYYEEKCNDLMLEVERIYGYTPEDAMLALKEIYGEAYFKRMGIK